LKWLKRKLINWLLKDVEIEELIVRKLITTGNTVYTDTIAEKTSGAGISFNHTIKVDTIEEKTSGAGVTIDGCLIKDGKAANADKLDGLDSSRFCIKDATWNRLVATDDIPWLPGVIKHKDINYLKDDSIYVDEAYIPVETLVIGPTLSMKNAYNSADYSESGASATVNVSSDEIEFVGGTGDTTYAWLYWNFPKNYYTGYLRVRINVVDCYYLAIEFCDADGSTREYPPNCYRVELIPSLSGQDFRLVRKKNGSYTVLATESVDLNYNQYYDVHMIVGTNDGTDAGIKVWRDNYKKFDYSDTSDPITKIRSVRLFFCDNDTASQKRGKFSGPLVVMACEAKYSWS